MDGRPVWMILIRRSAVEEIVGIDPNDLSAPTNSDPSALSGVANDDGNHDAGADLANGESKLDEIG